MGVGKKWRKIREGGIHSLMFLCALLSVVTTAGIIWVLVTESFGFFREVSIFSFLFGTRWSLIDPMSFGILPLVCGTFLVGVGALVVSLPVGLGAALFLSEYAPASVRLTAKPILEFLAGVPTVVYGYFAVSFITPNVLQPLFPQTETFNALSGALVVGIMIIPTVCSLSDDAFRAVPQTLREAAYALSATRFEVASRVVFPSAMSGVVAAVLLSFARAIGETMAVSLAAGLTPKLTANVLESIQTMTSYIVQIGFGEQIPGTVEYQSIFAVGIFLFLITLTVNLIAQRVLRRFREVYE
jgi:phosphate transport system permease protein